MTTRTSGRTAKIDEVLLEGSLVKREIDPQLPVARNLSPDCTLQRNRTVLFPLIYSALGAAHSLGGSGLGLEVRDDVGFSHDLRKYSMLNPQVKDAVQTRSYDFVAMETMGDRIKQLRRARNMTQEQFAQAVGVTKSAVSQWEDGSTKNLKLATFILVLDVLTTDAEFLIYGPERGVAAKRTWKARPGRAAGT